MRFDLFFSTDEGETPVVKHIEVVSRTPEDALAQFRAYQHVAKAQGNAIKFVMLERVFGKGGDIGDGDGDVLTLSDLLRDEGKDVLDTDTEVLGRRVWLIVPTESGKMRLRDPRTGVLKTLMKARGSSVYHVRVLNSSNGQPIGFLFATSEMNANAKARSLQRFVRQQKLAPVRTVVVERPAIARKGGDDHANQ